MSHRFHGVLVVRRRIQTAAGYFLVITSSRGFNQVFPVCLEKRGVGQQLEVAPKIVRAYLHVGLFQLRVAPEYSS